MPKPKKPKLSKNKINVSVKASPAFKKSLREIAEGLKSSKYIRVKPKHDGVNSLRLDMGNNFLEIDEEIKLINNKLRYRADAMRGMGNQIEDANATIRVLQAEVNNLKTLIGAGEIIREEFNYGDHVHVQKPSSGKTTGENLNETFDQILDPIEISTGAFLDRWAERSRISRQYIRLPLWLRIIEIFSCAAAERDIMGYRLETDDELRKRVFDALNAPPQHPNCRCDSRPAYGIHDENDC